MKKDEKQTSCIPTELETCARITVAAKQFLCTGIFPYHYEELSEALFIAENNETIQGERNWIDYITGDKKIIALYLEKTAEPLPAVVVSSETGDSVWQLESEDGKQIRAVEEQKKKGTMQADTACISRFTTILKKEERKNKKALKLLQDKDSIDTTKTDRSGICDILACSFIYSPYSENVYYALSLAQEHKEKQCDKEFDSEWLSVFMYCINELDLYRIKDNPLEIKYPMYKSHVQNAVNVIQEHIFPVCLNANNQLYEEIKRCPQLYILFKEATIDPEKMKAQPFAGQVQDKPTVFICSSREQAEHFIKDMPEYKYCMSEISKEDFASICCFGIYYNDLQFLIDASELFVQLPAIEYLKFVTRGGKFVLDQGTGGTTETTGSSGTSYPLGLYDYKPLYRR
jgi:hypothetical protein